MQVGKKEDIVWCFLSEARLSRLLVEFVQERSNEIANDGVNVFLIDEKVLLQMSAMLG